MAIVIVAVILAIAILQGIFVALMVRSKKKEGKLESTNYRAFFIMGIIWVPLSIILGIISFKLQIPFYVAFLLFITGFVYLLIGLKQSRFIEGKE